MCFRHTISQFAVRYLLYGTQLQRKCSFRTSKSRYLGKGYKTSVNLEDWDVDFVLQHFKLCAFVNEGDQETNS